MAKVEYKDVPVYFAHADGEVTDTTVVDTIIDKSVAEGTVKAADDAIRTWASNTFERKA